MYEGIAVSTLLYGSEMWATTVHDIRWLRVMERMCVGSVCGVHITVTVRNKEVRRSCDSDVCSRELMHINV
jgi:hypothetical protein